MSDLDKNINPFDDPDFMAFMMSMKKISEDRLMEMSYDLLIKNTDSALLHDAPAKHKVNAIDRVITFFESREEYEKCAKLQNIRNKIIKSEA